MGSNLPYVVTGTITDSDGANPSGIKVVARNDKTINNINTTTNASGEYILDLANLTNGWQVSESITIIVANGLESGSSSFAIATGEASQSVDITMTEIVDSADIAYCTIQEIYDELDGKTSTDIAANIIRDKVLRAEGHIDLKTLSSFKSNTFTSEIYATTGESTWSSPESMLGYGGDGASRVDSTLLGRNDTIKLRHRPILSITSLYRNTASSTATDVWGTLTEQEGSGGDFDLDKARGEIRFINNPPYFGKRRALKVSGTWGLDRTSTDRDSVIKRETVRELCILLTVQQILGQKGNKSQFDSQKNISLESISLTTSVSQLTGYLENITSRIETLFGLLGVFGTDMGMT